MDSLIRVFKGSHTFHGALLLCIALVSVPLAKPQSLAERLTVEQARKLVYAATNARLTGVPLEEDHSLYEPYFIALVAIDTNPDHRAVIATYAVNAWTGEVWNTAGRCNRVSSAKLRTILKELQSRWAIDLEATKELRANRPRTCGAS
jgi:hypothetical protein